MESIEKRCADRRTLVSLGLLSELGEVDGIFTGSGHLEEGERDQVSSDQRVQAIRVPWLIDCR